MKRSVAEKEQDIFESMELRHGPAYVQHIQDRIAVCKNQEIQYLEMKQMMDVLSRFRGRMRVMITNYRRWKVDYEGEGDKIEKVYKAYDGIFIRQQMRSAWDLYMTVNKDYHEMRRNYLANLRQFPHTRSGSA